MEEKTLPPGSWNWPSLDGLTRDQLIGTCRQYQDTIEQMNAKIGRYVTRAKAAGVDVADHREAGLES